MNDVSVIFPVAGASAANALWPATLEGVGGPLLPRETFALVNRSLVNLLDTPDAEYAALRVVSVRFDPCFPASPCQPQLRLVLQATAAGTMSAEEVFLDGAVHLLYNLTSDAFRTLAHDLRAMTSLAPENVATAPLGPSPALAAQGIDGAYGRALRALVTRHAGAGTLARMTFMTRTNSRAGQWEFGGVNVRGFSPVGPIAIVGLPANSTLQTLTRQVGADYSFSTQPSQLAETAIQPVLTGAGADQASPAARTAAYEAIVRIANPTLESPETVDCASCHVGGSLRRHLDAKYPPASPPATQYAGHTEARRIADLEGFAADDNLRALGYFQSAAVVSQRAANESHAVLGKLATMYP